MSQRHEKEITICNGFCFVDLDLKSVVHTICVCDDCQVHLELWGVFVVWWHNLGLVERPTNMAIQKNKRLCISVFVFTDTILQLSGYDSVFVITAKTSDEDVSHRYEKEIIMELEASSPLFTVLETLALLNLYCLICWFCEGSMQSVLVNSSIYVVF